MKKFILITILLLIFVLTMFKTGGNKPEFKHNCKQCKDVGDIRHQI